MGSALGCLAVAPVDKAGVYLAPTTLFTSVTSPRPPHPQTRRRFLKTLARLGAAATIISAVGGQFASWGVASAHAAVATAEPPSVLTGGPPATGSNAANRSDAASSGDVLKAAPGRAPLADLLQIESVDSLSEPILAALNQISNHVEPYWADLVADNLGVIRTAQTGELPQGAFAGMLVGAGGAAGGTAIFASTKADVYYLASVVVHEAWHYHQYLGEGPYYGRVAEQEAIQTQIDVLRGLSPSHYALGYLEESKDRVADGGPLPGNPPR